MSLKRYLGDGVYVEDSGTDLKLSALGANGHNNIIYLEDDVLAALVNYHRERRAGGAASLTSSNTKEQEK